VTGDGNTTVVVRSSPRIIAPDWRNRLRTAPPVIWVMLLVALTIVVVVGLTNLPAFGFAFVLIAVIGSATVGAKALNARVVITPEYIESRDALRRTRRCKRSVLVAWVPGRRGSLQRVFLVDREGRTQLSLAWDSYSDAQLDAIRSALAIPVISPD
jgi:hypothetical protein